MERLFEKIYMEVIVYEKDMEALGRKIEQRNEEASLKYKGRLKENEREGLVELLDDAALSAEKEGFYLGFCYACRMIFAILKK